MELNWIESHCMHFMCRYIIIIIIFSYGVMSLSIQQCNIYKYICTTHLHCSVFRCVCLVVCCVMHDDTAAYVQCIMYYIWILSYYYYSAAIPTTNSIVCHVLLLLLYISIAGISISIYIYSIIPYNIKYIIIILLPYVPYVN